MQLAFTHTSIMPFGKHKGKQMSTISPVYLMWLYDKGCDNLAIKLYIENNLADLKRKAGYRRIKV